MDFGRAEQYLPTPIVALNHMLSAWGVRGSLKNDALNRYQDSKKTLFDTALAIVGYIAAVKYAGRLGLAPVTIACLAAQSHTEASKFAVAGRFMFLGVTGAIAAGKADLSGLAKSVALAVFGYVANTQAGAALVQRTYAWI